jgi:hypothetical protein
MGPFLRYNQVFGPDPRDDDDGIAWAAGISFSYHLGRAEAAAEEKRQRTPARPTPRFRFNVPDTDRDGVTDDADQCREQPAGRRPDPLRLGCPENDEDGDGVPDAEDLCSVVAAGSEPDPKRAGCPFVDSDGDSIGDADDRCPDKEGPASEDAAKNGCPETPKGAGAGAKSSAGEAPATPAMPTPGATRKRGLTPTR